MKYFNLRSKILLDHPEDHRLTLDLLCPCKPARESKFSSRMAAHSSVRNPFGLAEQSQGKRKVHSAVVGRHQGVLKGTS